MQTQHPFFEDLSKLLMNARGVASDAKQELEQSLRDKMNAFLQQQQSSMERNNRARRNYGKQGA